MTPDRSHYWWITARDYGLQLPDAQEELAAALQTVLQQDIDIVEAIQSTVNQASLGEFIPQLLMRSDRAGVEARRILDRMLKAEAS